MKKQSVYIFIAIFLILSGINKITAQDIKWQTGTGDRTYASSVVVGEQVFAGSNNGRFYSIGINDGRQYFQYNTGNIINSIPLEYNGFIFFVSGNDLICFDPETLSEKWKFQNNASSDLIKFDQWDYHHSSPVYYDGVIYYGCGNGFIYGVDPETGEQLSSIESINNAAIRSTPVIKNGILYYGDWEGVVYAFDLTSEELKWSTQTYTGQHIDNYAGITTHIEVGATLVYYGARNHIINALNKSTGVISWTYTSLDGGWISGDPVLKDNYLLIGGSDNHKFLCFNALSGQLLWEYDFRGNCFSLPLIVEDKVVFTTGNAYANTGTNPGRGFIHVLMIQSGELYYEYELPGNVFSSPILDGGIVYIGCDDKNLYAFNGSVVLGISTGLEPKKKYDISDSIKFKSYPNPFINNTCIEFSIPGPGDVYINIIDMQGREIESIDMPGLFPGTHQIILNKQHYSVIGSSYSQLIGKLSFDGKLSKIIKLIKLNSL